MARNKKKLSDSSRKRRREEEEEFSSDLDLDENDGGAEAVTTVRSVHLETQSPKS